ncbi:MAG: immunoglobulin domain-containing protein [Melioribacteraceae bacterium]
MKIYILNVLLIISLSLNYAQTNYYVSNDGSANFKTIKEVNAAALNSGDIVSFKSDQQFSDAVLNCKDGVTYNTYGGSGKAIIGALNSNNNPTINIAANNVKLSSLTIYSGNTGIKHLQGYLGTSPHAVYGSGTYATITNCEIIGGNSGHTNQNCGIFWDQPSHLTVTNNVIHNLRYGMELYDPRNCEIAYNELYDLWYTSGHPNGDGGVAINLKGSVIESGAFDCGYTVIVHNNEVYNHERFAFTAVTVSKAIFEYNVVHDNLDETVYQGGIERGGFGKMGDYGASTGLGYPGTIGNIIRYNVIFNINAHQTSKVYNLNGGGTYVSSGAAAISAGSALDIWFHNNLIYNCNLKAIHMGYNSNPDYSTHNYSVRIYNNTFENVGGWQGYENGSGLTGGKNIIDIGQKIRADVRNNILSINTTTTSTGHGLYLGYFTSTTSSNNIFVNRTGTQNGSDVLTTSSAYFKESGATLTTSNDYYNTDPNLINQPLTISASNLGIYGISIPNYSIQNGVNANNIGINLGNDPSGRSLAYDILGVLRTTSDIGAIGVSDGSSINIPNPQSSTPIITFQPSQISVEIGNNATFTVEATCNDPIGYQWWKNPFVSESESKITDSDKYSGTTSNRLTVKNINNSDANTSYICEIYNTIDHSTLWINSNPARIQIISSNSSSDMDNIDSGLKVFLEAAYINNNKMNTLLVKSGLFPQKQPYNSSPWNLDISDNINEFKADYVDWVIVELRENLTNILYQKIGIITTDGTIVNTDQTPISFINISSGNFYIVIRHRNHLSIVSAEKIQVISGQKINYDFTSSINSAFGVNSLLNLGDNKFGMIAGDADANGVINNLDFGIVANNIPFRGYIQGDLDMNGMLNVLDYSFINKNIFLRSYIP